MEHPDRRSARSSHPVFRGFLVACDAPDPSRCFHQVDAWLRLSASSPVLGPIEDDLADDEMVNRHDGDRAVGERNAVAGRALGLAKGAAEEG